MNCPNCGNPVSVRRRNCETCGYDLIALRYLRRKSNEYYNLGLERARVRDLSGAVVMLKRSLDAYKENIEARNLLGLVYFEMGEIVAALSAWVISRSFPSRENLAEYYINLIQDNPTKLEAYNQAIRKYNIALESAKAGSDDLAIIQLKKVVELNPKFIKALQLLALLYMKNGDYKRAMKHLQTARSIDVANTTTLKYIAEIEKSVISEQGEAGKSKNTEPGTTAQTEIKDIAPKSSYHEDKPNRMAFINLLIGVVIGIAVVYYLIVPTVKQNAREEYKNEQVDYSGELASKTARIAQLEKQVTSLETTVSEQRDRIDLLEVETVPVEVAEISYDSIFAALRAYSDFEELDDYSDDQLIETALALANADTTGIEDENALVLLENCRTEIYKKAARTTYKRGKSAYDHEDYEEAVRLLSGAVKFDPTADSTMYYLGKAYQASEDFENAAYYYRLMLEVCPNSTLKQYIPQRLGEMGME